MDSATKNEIEEIVRTAVAAALAAREHAQAQSLIPRKAAAARLGVDVSTLWRWAKEGYLLPVRRGGRVWYLDADIQRLEGRS